MRRVYLLFFGCALALIIILIMLGRAWPADTLDNRLTQLECQVKQQREIIRYLYAQVYYPAGSKEGKLPEPKCLKKFMKEAK